MRQSRCGNGSCVAFAVALALAWAAWFLVESLRPTRPINHMNIAAALLPSLAAIGFAGVIATVQVVGLALGIVGLRQVSGARSAARIGSVLNGFGLFCTVIAIVGLIISL